MAHSTAAVSPASPSRRRAVTSSMKMQQSQTSSPVVLLLRPLCPPAAERKIAIVSKRTTHQLATLILRTVPDPIISIIGLLVFLRVFFPSLLDRPSAPHNALRGHPLQ
ncbi:hypothetical protein BU24DRAFT_410514 [Aaosphaeria arxii CBS 175.79]|uniref:Uncharacterized protein n=1 Tax=Aaosphaeria arxii CBS 175.79 TaxID=1450172 RepID=A0A6A5XQ09_9PLEO|nr:uncharacterized protein BU24DRAFT_410514 [Aaosphaeria arxii CBS 175.79]KAF2014810.1 hypothetical protein BU24DRAFT_410514 [Aaosphaeria arxii CBS 175.79]